MSRMWQGGTCILLCFGGQSFDMPSLWQKGYQMTYRETGYHIGGLMRCCLQTLGEFLDARGSEECTIGETLDCRFEKPGNKNMILGEDFIWRWNRENIISLKYWTNLS